MNLRFNVVCELSNCQVPTVVFLPDDITRISQKLHWGIIYQRIFQWQEDIRREQRSDVNRVWIDTVIEVYSLNSSINSQFSSIGIPIKSLSRSRGQDLLNLWLSFCRILFYTTQPAHVITIAAVLFVTSVLFPFKGRVQVSNHTSYSRMMSFIYLASFVIHLGAQIWMTFVSGMYYVYNREILYIFNKIYKEYKDEVISWFRSLNWFKLTFSEIIYDFYLQVCLYTLHCRGMHSAKCSASYFRDTSRLTRV